MPVSVVVVDDQQLVRAGFHALLGSDPDIDVVGEAANGIEALEVVGACKPDVVLMDVRMPEMDGLEATRRLLADNPATLARSAIRSSRFGASDKFIRVVYSFAVSPVVRSMSRSNRRGSTMTMRISARHSISSAAVSGSFLGTRRY